MYRFPPFLWLSYLPSHLILIEKFVNYYFSDTISYAGQILDLDALIFLCFIV